MKNLITRTLIAKLSNSSFYQFHHRFIRFHLLHYAAGDEAYRRRCEGCHAFSSSSPFLNSSSLSRRNYDEENRNVKVTVWWDFENCNIPGGVNVHFVSNRITWAIRSSGIKGPITITAFGDVAQLSRATQEALTSTGICLTHVPQSGKNSSDKSFMADIIYWVTQNPPPAHFFLISGDKDFANILHRLRMNNYNILIASTENASGVLCSAATIMWPWYELVRGENFIVRHFNYPPDGLYGSWYGHYKGVLDDPFADTVYPTTSQPEESMESIYAPKPRPVPKAVVKGIHHILRSYPEGISLSELRSELRKNSITLNKDFYGHKKFSYFLASLNLLKFLRHPVGDGQPSIGNGQPLVVGNLKKEPEQQDVSPSSYKENYTNGMHKDNCFALNEGDSVTNKTSISTEHPSNCKGRTLNANASAAVLDKCDHPVIDLEGHKGASDPQPTIFDTSEVSLKMDNIENKEGHIKKLWNSLTGLRIDSILKKSANILELDSSRHEDSSKNARNLQSSDLSEHVKPKDKATDTNNLFAQKEMYADKSIAKDSNPGQSETPNYVREQKDDLFGRILMRCKSMIYGSNDHDDYFKTADKFDQIDTADKSSETSPVSSNHPAAHELFSKSSFWDDLESFLLDPKGRHLILKSITREQLLQGLQNEGPSSLKELDENHLSHLGDILISEKKWVEESAFQKFPYKLLVIPKNSFVISQSSNLNGLSSLFSAKIKSNMHKLSDQVKEATEVSLTESLPPSKETGLPSRHEVISNCGNLLKELLEKNPTGFYSTYFQSEFRLKYGYNLDYRAVGFSKLTKLLLIVPGIKVENTYIRPSEECVRDILKEEGSGKDSQAENGCVDDSTWDELGPSSNSANRGDNKDCKPDKESTFSPVSLSDDEYTDSEEDVPMASDRSQNCKQSVDGGSLLLKILNSWDDKKEGCSRKQQNDINGMAAYCSRNAPQKKFSNTGAKRYSFVAKDADNDDFFAECTLEKAKKGGDLRLKELSE